MSAPGLSRGAVLMQQCAFSTPDSLRVFPWKGFEIRQMLELIVILVLHSLNTLYHTPSLVGTKQPCVTRAHSTRSWHVTLVMYC